MSRDSSQHRHLDVFAGHNFFVFVVGFRAVGHCGWVFVDSQWHVSIGDQPILMSGSGSCRRHNDRGASIAASQVTRPSPSTVWVATQATTTVSTITAVFGWRHEPFMDLWKATQHWNEPVAVLW